MRGAEQRRPVRRRGRYGRCLSAAVRLARDHVTRVREELPRVSGSGSSNARRSLWGGRLGPSAWIRSPRQVSTRAKMVRGHSAVG